MMAWLVRLWPVGAALLAALLAVLLLFGLYHAGYASGEEDADARWMEMERAAAADRLREIRDIERAERERQDGILRSYRAGLSVLDDVQRLQIAETLEPAGTELRGADPVSESERVQHCACNDRPADKRGLPGARRPKSGTVCYTEDELRRKIAASVAIAQECDREMMRFKTLIAVCAGSKK